MSRKSVSFSENLWIFTIDYSDEERMFKRSGAHRPPPPPPQQPYLLLMSGYDKTKVEERKPRLPLDKPPRPVKNFSMTDATLSCVYCGC